MAGKVIAVEESLSGTLKSALEREGYTVVRPGTAGRVDATVITGMDRNVMGMQDIAGGPVIIDASGKTAEEILKDLKERL